MQKKRIARAIAVATALLALNDAANAQAQGIKVEVSGQVNRALMNVNDGVQSNLFHVDTDTSSSRFRLAGSAPAGPGLRAGALLEVEFQSNPSNEVTFATQDVSPTLLERHMDVFLEGRWGKLSIGQGDGAANGGVEVDLSGTTVAQYAGVTDIAGGFAFRGPGGALSSATIATTINQQDFESRYDRLRYDTPVFGGFRLAGSVGTKDNGRDVTEVALWYSGDLGAIGRLAGAIGYSNQQGVPGGIDDKVIGGSVSWLHPSGFNLTAGLTERDLVGREGTFNYLKVGYKFGRHAVAADFALGDDQAAAADEGKMFGVAYVFTPAAWVELYAALKRHSLDRPGTSFEDIDVAMIGTRVKF